MSVLLNYNTAVLTHGLLNSLEVQYPSKAARIGAYAMHCAVWAVPCNDLHGTLHNVHVHHSVYGTSTLIR
jgi:hypothetical protein